MTVTKEGAGKNSDSYQLGERKEKVGVGARRNPLRCHLNGLKE